jgi:hypothetical protein
MRVSPVGFASARDFPANLPHAQRGFHLSLGG